MERLRVNTSRISCMLLVAACALPLSARAADSPTKTELLKRLAPLVAGERAVRFENVDWRGASIETLDAKGKVEGELRLSTDAPPWALPRFKTHSFYVTLQAHGPGVAITERLVKLAHAVDSRDDGSAGFVLKPPSTAGEGSSRTIWIAVVVTWLAASLLQYLRRGTVVWEFRAPHLFVALNQAAILGYLWIYWPGVGERVPSILAQVALAYAVDELVMMAMFGKWTVGLGPLPIVLSSNLFAWFGAAGSIIVVVVAIASRALIRRGGKHILNPSAIGLAVALACTYIFPASIPLEGVFSRLAIPPNMSELLLIGPLLPQLRFRIVLSSVGAILGLLIGGQFSGDIPGVAMPGTLILLTIFLTDPATQPKSPVGQLAFGLGVGLGVALTTVVGYALGAPDDRLAKILPVAVCNVLVPAFDALGNRAGKWWGGRFLAPKWNLAHIAVWLWLVVPGIIGQKADMFSGAFHWTYGTPLVVRGADDVPRCSDNPIFCRFFTFPKEISAWVARARSSHEIESSGLATTVSGDTGAGLSVLARRGLGVVGLWIAGITALHLWLNVDWTVVLNEYKAPEDQKLNVGFIPVTCHLTCPVTDYISEHSKDGTVFMPKMFQGFPEIKEALISNRMQAGFLVAPLAMALRSQGVPIKIVYLGHRYGSAVVVQKDGPIHSVKDLRGRTIAIPSRFSDERLLVLRALKANGIRPDEVKLLEMAPPDVAGALSVKAIDAFSMGEPFPSQAELGGYGRVLFQAKEYWPDYMSCVLVVRQDVIDQRPQAVQVLVDGIARSGLWLDEGKPHREYAADFVGRLYYHQSPALLTWALTQPLDRVMYEPLTPRKDDFELVQDLMIESGVLKQKLAFEDYVDTRFAEGTMGVTSWKFEPGDDTAR